jgi:virginiamycin B lyase
MKVSRFAAMARGAPALFALLLLAGCAPAAGDTPAAAAPAGDVDEFAIAYPAAPPEPARGSPCAGVAHAGSTHEIAYDEADGGDLWISGQNDDALARVTPNGEGPPRIRFQPVPRCSGPHGIAFDAAGRRWVTLEYLGRVVAYDRSGARVADHDVRLRCGGCAAEGINSHPHGLGVAPDGETIWFTGKATGTVGRIRPGGQVEQFALPTAGSVPIYIRAGPDGSMWVTELAGNRIARVTAAGVVTEFAIPTPYARPIAIVPGPDGNMWFSEEAGSKVARITPAGAITEFAVPRAHPNQILAGLAFDREGNLWVQQYVDHNVPAPGARDNIIRIDRAGLAGAPAALAEAHFTVFPVPSRDTVMHRIIQGPDGAMWFTEMHVDRVGRIAAAAGAARR